MDESPAPSARPRRARVALLLAGAVVLFAAAVGTGVALGRGGKGGDGGGTGAAAASTVAGGGSSSPTTSRATTTTSPATTGTTSTTVPPLQVTGHAVDISSSCKVSPFGYYDYTTRSWIASTS